MTVQFNVSDVALLMLSALASVLGLAGAGKLAGTSSRRDRALGAGEILLLGAMVVRPWAWPVAALVAAVFSAYAVRSWLLTGSDCQCFGANLPATSVAGQRFRNSALCVLGLTYFLTAGALTRLPEGAPVEIALGSVLGISLVVGPWLARWLNPDSSAVGMREG